MLTWQRRDWDLRVCRKRGVQVCIAYTRLLFIFGRASFVLVPEKTGWLRKASLYPVIPVNWPLLYQAVRAASRDVNYLLFLPNSIICCVCWTLLFPVIFSFNALPWIERATRSNTQQHTVACIANVRCGMHLAATHRVACTNKTSPFIWNTAHASMCMIVSACICVKQHQHVKRKERRTQTHTHTGRK